MKLFPLLRGRLRGQLRAHAMRYRSICFLWEVWSGSLGFHVPTLHFPFIALPWSASTGAVPGCWVGACRPGLCCLQR